MWDGIIATGFNGDHGYGEYDNITFFHVKSASTSSLDETLQAIKNVAKAYCEGEVESGWDMPYDWTWGDVFGDVPDEVFASAGIDITAQSADIVLYNDEIVVEQMTSEPGDLI